MKKFLLAGAILLLAPTAGEAAGWVVIGWNNLGMHCMDPDYGVFALLPPYNTLEAQLIDPGGRLVQSTDGVTLTYEAAADPSGSVNSTSIGKTNFWELVEELFDVAPRPDLGLAGYAMPGDENVPQPLTFDPETSVLRAEGIPITPHDDGGGVNSYPLVRVVARDAAGNVLASTEVVLPVSEELNCRGCHASDSSPAARPLAGWVRESAPPSRDAERVDRAQGRSQ